MRVLIKFDRVEKLVSLAFEFFQVFRFPAYRELVHAIVPEDKSFEIRHFFPVFHDGVRYFPDVHVHVGNPFLPGEFCRGHGDRFFFHGDV